MDGSRLQNRISYGYAKAAVFVGAPFNLYRSATPINPIVSGNLITQIKASTNISWEYMKGNRYGNAIWQIIIDAQYSTSPNSARLGDFIVGIPDGNGNILDNHTYFIMSLEYLQPPQAVQCNQVINIERPSQTTGAGNVGYTGYTVNPVNSQTIMTAMPASVLIESQGEKSPLDLPTDTKEPKWVILLPNLGNVEIRVDDIIIDNTQQNYVVTNNELTEFGWRLYAQQIINSR